METQKPQITYELREKRRIGIVDGEEDRAAILQNALQSNGYSVNIFIPDTINDEKIKREAWKLRPDGWILTENVPLSLVGENTFKVALLDSNPCSRRERDELSQCVAKVLDSGFDLAITESVSLEALVAHVRAIVKRMPQRKEAVSYGGTEFNFGSKVLKKPDNTQTTLSKKEIATLEKLFEIPGKVVSNEELSSSAWPGEAKKDTVLKTFISRLRDKIEDDSNSPQIIKTVNGWGYKIGQSQEKL